MTPIEAALARSFDRQNLAIYADELLASDDPRGELIHIDLANDPALADRRKQLEDAWLAGLPQPLVARSKYGFIAADVSDTRVIRALLESRYRKQLRHLVIGRSNPELEIAFYALRHGPVMPFLYSLSCSNAHGYAVLTPHAPVLDEAAPNLGYLHIDGQTKLLHLDHPNVKHLSIAGLGWLLNPPRLPHVTRFDCQFDPLAARIVTPELVRKRFAFYELPALEHLDLRKCTGFAVDAWSFLAGATLPPTLKKLTVARPDQPYKLDDIRTRFAHLEIEVVS